jgi:hypothetical protein
MASKRSNPGSDEALEKTFGVLVHEGWGKTFLVEADNEEEAQKIFEDSEDPYEDFTLSNEQMNETFVVEVSE